MDKLNPDEKYTRLVRVLTKNSVVTQPIDKKGFGSSGLYTGGKLFAFLSHKKRLVVKLPAERVEELVALGEGEFWDPRGSGRPLKEWFVLRPSSKMNWSPLATGAMEFVASLKTTGHAH
jgi:hypothetical protein